MSSLTVPRPAADEAAPYYHRYIAEAPDENTGFHLVDQIRQVDSVMASLSEEKALYRYAPGKWSTKEVLGHLVDAERIFAYRLLRISRGDSTPLPRFDENLYVTAARFDEWPFQYLLADFRAARENTISLLEGIHTEAWSNAGTMSGYHITARALAYIIVGHVAHHLAVLRERYGVGGES
jgi:hypothetical protein